MSAENVTKPDNHPAALIFTSLSQTVQLCNFLQRRFLMPSILRAMDELAIGIIFHCFFTSLIMWQSDSSAICIHNSR